MTTDVYGRREHPEKTKRSRLAADLHPAEEEAWDKLKDKMAAASGLLGGRALRDADALRSCIADKCRAHGIDYPVIIMTKPKGRPRSEIHNRVVDLYEKHPDWSCYRIAKEADCSETTVRKWLPMHHSKRRVLAAPARTARRQSSARSAGAQ
jgi:hypothetical protein